MIGLVGIALTAFVQRTAQIIADMFWGLFSEKEHREAKESKNQKVKRKQRKRKMCGTKPYPKETRQRNIRLTSHRNGFDVLRECDSKDFDEHKDC